MRVVILTFQRAANYGAVLQAYALRHTLSEMGHDVDILDYVPVRHKKIDNKPYKGSVIITKAKSVVRKVVPNRRSQECQAFALRNLSLTKQVNENTIITLSDKYDAVIVGSDQVWNLDITNDDYTYYLDFVPDTKLKIAYAASFGTSSVRQGEETVVAKAIDRFDSVSVREESAVDICNSIHVNNSVQRVLDPTLLASQDMWNQLADLGREYYGKYVLLYVLRDSAALLDAAKRYASQHNCDIICVSRKKRAEKGITYLTSPSVEDFVALFRNAELVLTNSFHGICLSVQFERQIAYELFKGTGRHLRLVELSKMLGIENRELSSSVTLYSDNIDYVEVNTRLIAARNASQAFLERALTPQRY